MKKLLLLIIFLSCWTLLPAQLSYGTTGLLHAPSADMQKDKTVMLGGNFLHQELTPPKFNFNTWNYYLNVTIFPFLEVAYTCTLFTAESLGLDKHGYSGFTNQDRYFSARLRVLKESNTSPLSCWGLRTLLRHPGINSLQPQGTAISAVIIWSLPNIFSWEGKLQAFIYPICITAVRIIP